jgi:hypothetical protein
MERMSDEWLVRVHGKEYGPVDVDELRDWRREGRLIRENELRRVGEERWIPAGELVEVFADRPVPPPLPTSPVARARTWREVIRETLRIYRAGIGSFIAFGLLTAVPMFALQLTLPKFSMPDFSSGTITAPAIPALPPISLAMLVVVLATWPITTAGLQLVADDAIHGRRRSFGERFSAALRLWGRVAALSVFVYGSYFFWSVALFTGMMAAIGGGASVSLVGLLLFLSMAAFLVYIIARLFINFLFWQQTGALGQEPGLLAIRESKRLARSVPEAPRLDRPLYRGAIVVSVWSVLLLALTIGIQFPLILVRFMGAATPEEAMEMARKVAEANTPDAFTLAADVGSAVLHLLLRPLLVAGLVVLYYDAKARSGSAGD